MILKILLGFLPWIILNFLPKNTPEQFTRSILLVLLITAISNYQTIKKGFILPICSGVFFLLILLIEIIYPNMWLITNNNIINNFALSTIALFSLIFKHPFTLQYAREQQPPEKWQHPVFIYINNILTSIWTLIFVFNLTINILSTHYNVIGKTLSIILTNASSFSGILITTWYPNWYRQYLKTKTKNNLSEAL